jgi:HAD superfamily hydrolase (TIGR01493 family)
MIEAVVFDWGDTVMRDFRVYEGPMAYWPLVEAVEGVDEVLRVLQPRYRLALATNASDSNENLVRWALYRAGLNWFFEKVFVSSDLGVEKPDGRFFASVLTGLRLPAQQVVMVGDNYTNDVLGAKTAGLWTVWFNPGGGPIPAASVGNDVATHDVEISDLSRLEAALMDLELRAAQPVDGVTMDARPEADPQD